MGASGEDPRAGGRRVPRQLTEAVGLNSRLIEYSAVPGNSFGLPTASDPEPMGRLVDLRDIAAPVVSDIAASMVANAYN